MEKDDKGSTLIRIGVSGGKFLLVPAYPGCPGSKAVKRSLLLLLLNGRCIHLWLAVWMIDNILKVIMMTLVLMLVIVCVDVVETDIHHHLCHHSDRPAHSNH